MDLPLRLMSRPPAFPIRTLTLSDASTTLVSLGCRRLANTFFPSEETEIQVFSSALSPTRTGRVSSGAVAGAAFCGSRDACSRGVWGGEGAETCSSVAMLADLGARGACNHE